MYCHLLLSCILCSDLIRNREEVNNILDILYAAHDRISTANDILERKLEIATGDEYVCLVDNIDLNILIMNEINNQISNIEAEISAYYNNKSAINAL